MQNDGPGAAWFCHWEKSFHRLALSAQVEGALKLNTVWITDWSQDARSWSWLPMARHTAAGDPDSDAICVPSAEREGLFAQHHGSPLNSFRSTENHGPAGQLGATSSSLWSPCWTLSSVTRINGIGEKAYRRQAGQAWAKASS